MLDSGTVVVPPLTVGVPVIDITEPIFKSPLVLSEVIVIENVVPDMAPVSAGEVLVAPVATAKLVIVTELPPLVKDMAIFPTDTLSLILLKVIL